MKLDFDNKFIQLATLLFLAFVWGSSFIIMKRSLLAFDAYQVAAFRMFLSALFILPITVKHLSVLRNRSVLMSLFISALMGNFLPSFMFTIAQTQISSSLTGMLNALTPFWALAVGVFLYKSKTHWWNITGVVIGLVGAIGLILSGDDMQLVGDWKYAMLVVAATLFYGINVNEVKEKLAAIKPVAISSLALSLAGIGGGVYLLFSDFDAALQSPYLYSSFSYILLLSFVGTTIALLAFNMLIKHTSAIYASSVTYIIPIFAIFWGLLDGENLSSGQLIFMFIILTGVYMVNKK